MHNSREFPNSAPSGDLLVECAKKSARVRNAFVRLLLKPEPYLPSLPRVKDGDLVTAIMVTIQAENLQPPDAQRMQRWARIRRNLYAVLEVRGKIPVKQDVAVLRRVLSLARSWMYLDRKFLEKTLEKDLKLTEGQLLETIPKSEPRRGRHFEEHSARIAATIELLKQCKQKKPEEKVREILCDKYGIHLARASVRDHWERYRDSPLRHPDLKRLPAYWLSVITWSFPGFPPPLKEEIKQVLRDRAS